MFRFLQRPLAQLISTLRAPKSKEGYASIGGGSPLRKITDEQVYIQQCGFCYCVAFDGFIMLTILFSWKAHALEMALEAKDLSANVYVAMRYWRPFTEEAVDKASIRTLHVCLRSPLCSLKDVPF